MITLTDRQRIVNALLHEVGTVESPANSNNIKYNTWFYDRPVHDGDKSAAHKYPWCMVFCVWILHKMGFKFPKIDYTKGTAYVPHAYDYFKKNDMLTEDPKPGDLAFIDWDGNGKLDHVEQFIEWVDKGKIARCVGGNTAMKKKESNGGQVCDQPRDVKFIKAFGSIDKIINPKH